MFQGRKAVIAGVAFLAAIGTAVAARAAGEDAEALIKKGVELRRAGDDAGALRVFQDAYAIDHSPRALAQMGLAEQALGRWSLAEKHVNEALVLFGADPWIRKNVQVLETALTFIRDHLGSVIITVAGDDGAKVDADLTVDGQPVDRVLWTGQPLRLAVGAVNLRFESPGYRTQTVAVAITHERAARLTVTLVREAVATRPPARDTARTTDASTATSSAVATVQNVPRPARQAEPPHGAHRVAGLIVSGVGLAALGVGAVFAQKVKSASDEVTSARMFSQTTQDAGLRAQTLEFVFLGAGAAALVTGTVLFFWPSSETGQAATTARASLWPTVAPGFAGASLSLALD
jgi:hypothetical protein